MSTYPPKAYSPTGQLWWDLRTWPGRPRQKFGTEPRLAAYLRFNAEIGGILTLRKLRKALGKSNRPNDHEHFNRHDCEFEAHSPERRRIGYRLRLL